MGRPWANRQGAGDVAVFRGLSARILLLAVLVAAAVPALAAPFAAYVMDGRTGEMLYARNADARLHPASLTKMMTLYIAFEAIERGEISLDTRVTISANAAGQAPSRLGLKAGQKIALRYLIRAAALKSANDAATAIGEAISGSEDKFATRMNRTAKALGMTNSTFKNANGLTAPGHLSTARDMSVLGRRLFYDFPQYYNIFSRRSADAGMAEVANTNRRFLDAYKGADGIKTGYTVAAGFNLTASAERGGKRIIATVLGGTSTANRNAKMAELLDLGFGEAPRNAPEDPPDAPVYLAEDETDPEAEAIAADAAASAGKTIRLVTTMATSPRPRARPAEPAATVVAAAEEVPSEAAAAAAAVDGMSALIESAVADAAAPLPFALIEETAADAVAEATAVAETPAAEAGVAVAAAPGAPAAAEDIPFEVVDAPQAGEALPFAVVDAEGNALSAPGEAPPLQAEASMLAMVVPAPRPPAAVLPAPAAVPEPEAEVAVLRPAPAPDAPPLVEAEPVVVTRMSTSGGRNWGISLGEFAARGTADRLLMRTMLAESTTVGLGLRKVIARSGGYDATIVGLSEDEADLACRRLRARAMECTTLGP